MTWFTNKNKNEKMLMQMMQPIKLKNSVPEIQMIQEEDLTTDECLYQEF